MRDAPTTRWFPIAVNSVFLLGAIVLPGCVSQENAYSKTIRRAAACGPFGPVAGEYVDRDKVCRRARREVLQSLRTGRDPDWDDVFRDWIPKASKHPRRHRDYERPRSRGEKHQPSTTPSPSARKEPRASEPASPTSRADVQPSYGTRPSSPSETVKAPVSSAPPTSPADSGGHMPGAAGWAGVGILLILIAGAACIGGCRKPVVRAVTLVRERITRGIRPKAGSAPQEPSMATSPGACSVAGFATKSVSVAGAGAEDAVRRLAIDVLLGRRGDALELVLSRSDAWRLFGMDPGVLQDDRIPGLVLTDDQVHTRAYLARQGSARRLLITCNGHLEDLRALPAHQQGQLTVVSLSSRSEASVGVSTGGEVTASHAGRPVPGHLPLLSKSDAYNQLMSMPTLARRVVG